MKPYILVSVWADDDDATRVSHAFALELHERCAAAHFVDGEAPSHEDLKTAVDRWPEAAIVIFAHGGAALSARRLGAAWIRAEELAAILSGRRVYAFACSTFVPQRALLLNTFASLAVDACVNVFVGHEAPVMTPFAGQTGATQNMVDVISGLIESFIDGEDDEDTLVEIGRMRASWDKPVEIDLPSEDPDREGAFGWSSVGFLRGFFKCLRVRTKAQATLLVSDSA
jgi:hypothetical protein